MNKSMQGDPQIYHNLSEKNKERKETNENKPLIHTLLSIITFLAMQNKTKTEER